MALVRWNPGRELASMEVDRLNQMFSNFYGDSFARNWVPAVRFRGKGRYTVTLQARDTSGLTSAPARRSFSR